jgi:hypothetical protein
LQTLRPPTPATASYPFHVSLSHEVTTINRAQSSFFHIVIASSDHSSQGFAITAIPNTTAPVQNKATLAPPFTTATFFVPAADSLSHQVGFLTETNVTGVVAKGFLVAGGNLMALFTDDTGRRQGITTRFRAFPTGSSGIWSLNWNITSVTQTPTNDWGVVVVLRP